MVPLLGILPAEIRPAKRQESKGALSQLNPVKRFQFDGSDDLVSVNVGEARTVTVGQRKTPLARVVADDGMVIPGNRIIAGDPDRHVFTPPDEVSTGDDAVVLSALRAFFADQPPDNRQDFAVFKLLGPHRVPTGRTSRRGGLLMILDGNGVVIGRHRFHQIQIDL